VGDADEGLRDLDGVGRRALEQVVGDAPVLDRAPFNPHSPDVGARLARDLQRRRIVGSLSRELYARSLAQAYGDPARITPALVDRYWELSRRPGNRDALLRRSATNDAFPFDALRGVRAPVLLQWGGRDRWVPPSQAAAFRARLPGAELRVYPDAGHAPMEELPAPTAADARRFLLGGPAASR